MLLAKRIPIQVRPRIEWDPFEDSVAMYGDWWCKSCGENVDAISVYGHDEPLCKECHGEVDQADHCKVCGDAMDPYPKNGIYYICPDCLSKTTDALTNAIGVITNQGQMDGTEAIDLLMERLEAMA